MTSQVMEISGAKQGELPVFKQPEFTSAQANFRQKLQQYHSTQQMPVDTSTYTNCDVDANTLQVISGFA